MVSFMSLALFLNFGLGQTDTGPHGGQMKKAGNYLIEINNSGTRLYCWLLNENAKPIENKNIICDVKFYFPDHSVLDSRAEPLGKDGFSIKNAGLYFSCQVRFRVHGKYVSANFESISPIVNIK